MRKIWWAVAATRWVTATRSAGLLIATTRDGQCPGSPRGKGRLRAAGHGHRPAGASRGPRRAGEAELEELVQAATVGRLGKPRLREAVCALVVPWPPPVGPVQCGI